MGAGFFVHVFSLIQAAASDRWFCVDHALIDRCLRRAICRAERPGDLQPTDPAPLPGNRAGGLAGKYAERFAGHIWLPIRLGSSSPLMTSTYGQPPGWPDASCQPIGPDDLPANWPDSFAGQTDRATCEQAVQGDWLQTARPSSDDLAANFLAGDSQRFLKIANDRLREPTIPRIRQRWTTIARARSTRANAGQRSALKNRRMFNARQRRTTISAEKTTHVQRSPTPKCAIGTRLPEGTTGTPGRGSRAALLGAHFGGGSLPPDGREA